MRLGNRVRNGRVNIENIAELLSWALNSNLIALSVCGLYLHPLADVICTERSVVFITSKCQWNNGTLCSLGCFQSKGGKFGPICYMENLL